MILEICLAVFDGLWLGLWPKQTAKEPLLHSYRAAFAA